MQVIQKTGYYSSTRFHLGATAQQVHEITHYSQTSVAFTVVCVCGMRSLNSEFHYFSSLKANYRS